MNGTPIEKEEKILDLPKILLYSLELFALILAISFLYLSVNSNQDYSGVYSEHAQKEVIKSLVTSLKLYTVHEIPYTGIIPKIQIYITENTHFVNSYYLEITRGDVIIRNGETNEKDIIIRTTEEEVLKIVDNGDYMKESLSSGKTIVEKATSDFVLFTKGYPDIFINKK